jgi:Rrf2 family protein
LIAVNLQLSQKTEYAYDGLLLLDEAGDGYIPGKTIAHWLDISPEYLTKIMGPLVRSGWLVSSSGTNGGYKLAIDLTNHCVLDLIEIVEGKVDRSRCMHGDTRNPALETCALHEPWVRARDALLTELEVAPLARSGHTSPRKGE